MHPGGRLGDDLFAREQAVRPLEDVGQRQRVVHHQTLHVAFSFVGSAAEQGYPQSVAGMIALFPGATGDSDGR